LIAAIENIDVYVAIIHQDCIKVHPIMKKMLKMEITDSLDKLSRNIFY
jgi:hypothetical protein